MSEELLGKVAFITGGGSGIGRETALLFAASGARVVVTDIDAQAAEETVELIADGTATAIQVDVAQFPSVERALAKTMERFGRLDVAFNNAGINSSGVKLADVQLEDWDRTIAVDLTGVFYCMKAQIPLMLMGGKGSIVNTASGAGILAVANMAAYVAAKHGVVGLTKAGALEYSRHGLRINAVLPGVIETPLMRSVVAANPGFEAERLAQHPIGHFGLPRDIAEAALYLASDRSAFVTGHSLNVDGGKAIQ